MLPKASLNRAERAENIEDSKSIDKVNWFPFNFAYLRNIWWSCFTSESNTWSRHSAFVVAVLRDDFIPVLRSTIENINHVPSYIIKRLMLNFLNTNLVHKTELMTKKNGNPLTLVLSSKLVNLIPAINFEFSSRRFIWIPNKSVAGHVMGIKINLIGCVYGRYQCSLL